MAIETFPFEPEQFFQSPDAQARLLADAMESGHAGYIARAVGIVARNRGMADPGGAGLDTLIRVLAALDLELLVRPKVAA